MRCTLNIVSINPSANVEDKAQHSTVAAESGKDRAKFWIQIWLQAFITKLHCFSRNQCEDLREANPPVGSPPVGRTQFSSTGCFFSSVSGTLTIMLEDLICASEKHSWNDRLTQHYKQICNAFKWEFTCAYLRHEQNLCNSKQWANRCNVYH